LADDVLKSWGRQKLPPATGLCAGVALEFLSARNRCPAFDKDKY